jgi:hypothetical protein
MTHSHSRNYLEKAIDLSEAYLNIPECRDNNELPEALKQIATHRMNFLEDFSRRIDFDLRQGQLNEVAQKIIEENKHPRTVHHIEYELAFCGINTHLTERFRPLSLEKITFPDGLKKIHHLPWAADSINTWDISLSEFDKSEDARHRYSSGKYLDTKDLNDIVWYSAEVYTDLKDELEEFLTGKNRILEVGFLHQRVKDVIHSINPNIEYHGVDISIPAVQQARDRNIIATNANAWYAIPYPDDYFDGIVSVTIQAAGLLPNEEWLRVLNNKKAIFNASLQ